MKVVKNKGQKTCGCHILDRPIRTTKKGRRRELTQDEEDRLMDWEDGLEKFCVSDSLGRCLYGDERHGHTKIIYKATGTCPECGTTIFLINHHPLLNQHGRKYCWVDMDSPASAPIRQLNLPSPILRRPTREDIIEDNYYMNHNDDEYGEDNPIYEDEDEAF